jgi:hypothetical protein
VKLAVNEYLNNNKNKKKEREKEREREREREGFPHSVNFELLTQIEPN